MATQVGPNESLADIMDALETVIFPGALATTTVHLFKNDVTPGIGTQLGDLTEADFTGYASVAITAWGHGAVDPLTGFRYTYPTVPGPCTFTQTGVVITNTVYGYWLEYNGHILAAERFDNPLPMDTSGKSFAIYPHLFPQAMYGPDALED